MPGQHGDDNDRQGEDNQADPVGRALPVSIWLIRFSPTPIRATTRACVPIRFHGVPRGLTGGLTVRWSSPGVRGVRFCRRCRTMAAVLAVARVARRLRSAGSARVGGAGLCYG